MILNADARAIPLADESVQCVVTSPPYWGLRDYGNGDAGIGLEDSPDAWVEQMVAVFQEVRRVLRDDGTVWLNVGDAYASSPVGTFNGGGEILAGRDVRGIATSGAIDKVKASGLKQKDLIGLPWRLAFALQADGWYLRSDIIWSKPNPMPESVRDRPTKAHEYVFLLTKSARYYYDADAVRETYANGIEGAKPGKANGGIPNIGGRKDGFARGTAREWEPTADGRNLRSVWHIATKPFPEAHFATFPPDLVIPCIKAGSREEDLVLDPFAGAGTACLVARKLARRWVGLELNPAYCRMSAARINREAPPCLFDSADNLGDGA